MRVVREAGPRRATCHTARFGLMVYILEKGPPRWFNKYTPSQPPCPLSFLPSCCCYYSTRPFPSLASNHSQTTKSPSNSIPEEPVHVKLPQQITLPIPPTLMPLASASSPSCSLRARPHHRIGLLRRLRLRQGRLLRQREDE